MTKLYIRLHSEGECCILSTGNYPILKQLDMISLLFRIVIFLGPFYEIAMMFSQAAKCMRKDFSYRLC